MGSKSVFVRAMHMKGSPKLRRHVFRKGAQESQSGLEPDLRNYEIYELRH